MRHPARWADGDGFGAARAPRARCRAHTLRLVRGRGCVRPRTVAFWLDDGRADRVEDQALRPCQSQAAAAGDRLYLGATDDCLYCVEAATGDVVGASSPRVRSRPETIALGLLCLGPRGGLTAAT